MSPMEQGSLAFRKGNLSNPYHVKFKFRQHRAWQFGFDIAYFKNLEKVKSYEDNNKSRRRGQGIQEASN